MSVYTLCEQAIGLVRGKRLILSSTEKTMLENLNYDGLTGAHAQEEAVVCALHFARVRDRLLELHPWTFARKSSSVSAGDDLSSDCLTVLCVCSSGKPIDYVQTGTTLNVSGTVYYTAQITDTTKWSAAFSDVFCYSLAEEICTAVTGEPQYTQILEAKVQELLRRAYMTGAIQPETRLTETQELYHRAIVLSRGTRSISGSGNTASEQGADILGALNWRTQAEMNACEAGAPVVRDRLLEGYAWKFARKSAALTATTTITGWSYGYSLPADCMKVIAVMNGADTVEYEQAADKIYCNVNGVTARYTAKITDVTAWAGIFKDIFTYQLAEDIILATTGNAELIKLLEEKIQLLLSEALATGDIQQDSNLSLSDDIYGRAIDLANGMDDTDPKLKAREFAVCRRNAGYIRDRLLNGYAWRFARKRQTYATSSTGASGWAYKVAAPADCMKVLAVLSDGEPVDFEEAGTEIYSNSAKPTVIYTGKITDISEWPGLFADVFCYELAKEILISIGTRTEVIPVFEEKSQQLITEAVKTGVIRAENKIPASMEIYNRAISLVRGQRVLSPSGNASVEQGTDITGDVNYIEREALNVCRRSLPELKDKLLRLYGWKFARKSLTLSAGSRVSGWLYAYLVPADCMKVLCVLSGDEPVEYEEVNGQILTDATGTITARYTRAVSDLSELDAVFREVLCYELAAEIGGAIAWNSEQISLLEQKKQQLIQNAIRTGTIQEESNIPVKDELCRRAVLLADGTRTVSGTSEAALSQGMDITGMQDVRYIKALKAAKGSYDMIRDKLAGLYPWLFLRKSTALTAATTIAGWTNGYNKPADCLTVLTVLADGEAEDWEEAGTRIYSNGENAVIRYTSKMENISAWPSLFCDVFVYGLAVEISASTTGATQLTALLEQKLAALIQDGYKIGAIKTEPRIPVTRELFNRAIGLVKGLKTGSADNGKRSFLLCTVTFYYFANY